MRCFCHLRGLCFKIQICVRDVQPPGDARQPRLPLGCQTCSGRDASSAAYVTTTSAAYITATSAAYVGTAQREQIPRRPAVAHPSTIARGDCHREWRQLPSIDCTAGIPGGCSHQQSTTILTLQVYEHVRAPCKATCVRTSQYEDICAVTY
jgi:hypothetical protein